MLLDDVATFLATQSTKFTVLSGTGGNLVKGRGLDASPAPDTLTVLQEAPGLAPMYTFSSSTAVRDSERPRLQILCRSTSYQTARNNAETAFTLLDGYSGGLPTATGTDYRLITAVQSPFLLQYDPQQRPVVACNYQVWKTTG